MLISNLVPRSLERVHVRGFSLFARHADLIADLRRVAEAGDVVGLRGDADVAVDLGAVLDRHDERGDGGGHLKNCKILKHFHLYGAEL